MAEPVTTDLVEYLIVVVPDVESLAGVTAALDGLVQAATIRVLDVIVVTRRRDGSVEVFEFEDVSTMTSFRVASRDRDGLLSEHDIAMASHALRPGTSGLVLVVEDRWAASLSAAARATGGEIIAGERIPAGRVATVLGEIREGGRG